MRSGTRCVLATSRAVPSSQPTSTGSRRSKRERAFARGSRAGSTSEERIAAAATETPRAGGHPCRRRTAEPVVEWTSPGRRQRSPRRQADRRPAARPCRRPVRARPAGAVDPVDDQRLGFSHVQNGRRGDQANADRPGGHDDAESAALTKVVREGPPVAQHVQKDGRGERDPAKLMRELEGPLRK